MSTAPAAAANGARSWSARCRRCDGCEPAGAWSRGITRNRKRSLLTIGGVAVSLSLVLVFAGLRDTVSNVVDRQFGTIQRQGAEVGTAPGALPSVLSAVSADPAVQDRVDVVDEAQPVTRVTFRR